MESFPVTPGQGFGFVWAVQLWFKSSPPQGCWRYFQGKKKNGTKAASAMWVQKQSWGRDTNLMLTGTPSAAPRHVTLSYNPAGWQLGWLLPH